VVGRVDHDRDWIEAHRISLPAGEDVACGDHDRCDASIFYEVVRRYHTLGGAADVALL